MKSERAKSRDSTLSRLNKVKKKKKKHEKRRPFLSGYKKIAKNKKKKILNFAFNGNVIDKL